jgi:hypothetical protein
MLLLEELKIVNDIIKDIAIFIQTNPLVSPDFEEYLKAIGIKNEPTPAFQSACFNYIFERNLGESRETIIDLYLLCENFKKLQKEDKRAKSIVEALNTSISSIFSIKRVLKNGFKFDNIINEKSYDVTSLVKMSSFKGIGVGQHVVARIFNWNEASYLLEISGVLPVYKTDDALRYAVAKIIQNPELVYIDNPEKEEEIKDEVADLYKKFIEYFGKDEVITTNKFADDIISMFNDYAESGEKAAFKSKIKSLDEYKFFDVSEFNNAYSNFLENSLGGFSSHKETYDVAVIYDKELGLYAVPFYETFNKIFEADNYKDIEGYDKCIDYFLNNDKFSANIIKRVADKHKNFVEVVNEIYNTKLTLDEILKKYKSRYLKTKIYSSTTVLYKSSVFSKTLGIVEEKEEKPKIDYKGVGRNDPCPCGSGKKFKKCCGANL